MDQCPKCGNSWIGEPIPANIRQHYGNHTHFKREIGVEIQGKGDRIDYYFCPDCNHTVDRAEYDAVAYGNAPPEVPPQTQNAAQGEDVHKTNGHEEAAKAETAFRNR